MKINNIFIFKYNTYISNMKNLIDVYNEDQTLCLELLNSSNIKVTPKLHGISLQVYLNEEKNKYEFIRHTKEFGIGPKISALTKLFCKPLSEAMSLIENRIEAVNKYKFLNFVLYDREMVLLSAIRRDDPTLIDDVEQLRSIAFEFDAQVNLPLWEGKLSEDQQRKVVNLMSSNTIIDSNEFKDIVEQIFYRDLDDTNTRKAMFPIDLYKELKSLEGIVFNFKVNEKTLLLKVEDKVIRQNIDLKKAQIKRDKEMYKKNAEEVVKCMIAWLEKADLKTASEKWLDKLQDNFVQMTSHYKMYNKLMNKAGNLPLYYDFNYALQVSKLKVNLQKLIKKNGKCYQALLETFLLYFYSLHNDMFVDKETTKRLNTVITKM